MNNTKKQAFEKATKFFLTVESKYAELGWFCGIYRVIWSENGLDDLDHCKEFHYTERKAPPQGTVVESTNGFLARSMGFIEENALVVRLHNTGADEFWLDWRVVGDQATNEKKMPTRNHVGEPLWCSSCYADAFNDCLGCQTTTPTNFREK